MKSQGQSKHASVTTPSKNKAPSLPSSEQVPLASKKALLPRCRVHGGDLLVSIIKTSIKGCFLSIPCLGKYPHICPNHKILQERRPVKVRIFLASLTYDLHHFFFLLPPCHKPHTWINVLTCTYTDSHHWPYSSYYSSHSLPLIALPFIDLGSNTNLFLLKHTKTTLNKLAMPFHLKLEINRHHLTKPHSDKLSYKELPRITKPVIPAPNIITF